VVTSTTAVANPLAVREKARLHDLTPGLLFIGGLALMASAIILFLRPDGFHGAGYGSGFLAIALGMIWLGPGLQLHSPRATAWFLRASVGGCFALAFAGAVVGIYDLRAVLHNQGGDAVRLTLVLAAAVVVFGVLMGTLLSLPIKAVHTAWVVVIALLTLGAVAGWGWMVYRDITAHHRFLYAPLSLLALVPVLLVRRAATAWHKRDVTLNPPPKARRPRPKEEPYFANPFQEYWAKGRFCELFELPCTGTCPLATAVAARYQQLRMTHEHHPEQLAILEKAYGMLVTPRTRALCSVAHEIMRAKAKEFGEKKFTLLEAYLWQEVWTDLNDEDVKGDPERAQKAKVRLIKEL
jgi:hypothetical protein